VHFACIVGLCAVNNIKIMSFVQEYFCGKFILLATVKYTGCYVCGSVQRHCVYNKIKCTVSSCAVPSGFVRF
jgi:hypothetical protein